jgi:hypothetical protein
MDLRIEFMGDIGQKTTSCLNMFVRCNVVLKQNVFIYYGLENSASNCPLC